MEKKKNAQIFWFFTNRQLVNYVLMISGLVGLNILNIFVNLKYLEVQKNIQNGMVLSNWELFLLLGVATAILAAIIEVYQQAYGMTMTKYLHFNLFRKYRKSFQIYETAVRLKSNLISNLFGIFENFIDVSLNIFLAIKTAELIEVSKSFIVGALILLTISIACGIYRGIKRAYIGELTAKIATKENDLTKFYAFCKDFLENALFVLGLEYDSRIKNNIKTSMLTHFPPVLKSLIVLIGTYGLINTIVEGEVYSTGYIVIAAYSTVLTISRYISSMFENIFTCIKVSKNKEIKKLDDFEKKEKFVLKSAKDNISISDDKTKITIFQNFTADVHGEDRVRYYYLNKALQLIIGKNIQVIGKKGTGKTRFLQILESLFENKIMIFNDKTKVFDKFEDNFKSDIGWNYELIQRLAKGLKLTRLQIPEEELKNLDFHSINTGDMHLVVGLVMLYYAISKPEHARIIILDELLANVDKENSVEILEFIHEIKQELGCSIIFVGHSNQDEISKYCSQIWTMEVSGASVIIDTKYLE